MGAPICGGLGRRSLLLAAAAFAASPLAARAAAIYTPHEVAEAFRTRVQQRLAVPPSEAAVYAWLAELQLLDAGRPLWEPQYLLVVDRDPHVQAALLYWRLSGRSWELLGAAPASTGGPTGPGHLETPLGAFEQQVRASQREAAGTRVFDFGWQRTRAATGQGPLLPARLQARAATGPHRLTLGRNCSNGCVLLPSALTRLIDELGLLDGEARQGEQPLPYAGRLMLVLDSQRGERPEWSPAPG